MMSHDIGGLCSENDKIDLADKALLYWEKSIHAILVLLATHAPPLITTDELRRGVESLEEKAYREWGYYERWSVSIASILLERGVLGAAEFDEQLFGSDIGSLENPFAVGDIVEVHSEDHRTRWRKPHLRSPGYIFKCTGRIEKFIGTFKDPFFLAFRGDGPPQHLYTVSFKMKDIWSDYENDIDRTSAEIYHSWLSPSDSNSTKWEEVVLLNHSIDHNHHHDHQHSHDHDHNDNTPHLSRTQTEVNAVEKEGEDTPGKIVGEALVRTLVARGLFSYEDIRRTVEKLETAGSRLDGALLVVKAWTDHAFKERLLNDGKTE